LQSFNFEVTRHTMLHENFTPPPFFGALPKDAHPMPVCAARSRARELYQDPESDETDPAVGDPLDRQDANDRGLLVQALRRSAVRVPAQRPRLRVELHAHDVRGAVRGLSARPADGETLDLLLILHADHEQKLPTSTVRMVGSSQAICTRRSRRHQRAVGTAARRREPKK